MKKGKQFHTIKREAHILQELSEGKTAKDIASELFATQSTIELAIHSMRKERGAKNTVQMVADWLRQQSDVQKQVA